MIIWLVPPESLVFVRVHYENYVEDLPIQGHNYTVVGYERGVNPRRVFTVRDYDCILPGGFIPSEAVDPSSL